MKICICNDINTQEVKELISAGANTVDEILDGRSTCATCHNHIQSIIDEEILHSS